MVLDVIRVERKTKFALAVHTQLKIPPWREQLVGGRIVNFQNHFFEMTAGYPRLDTGLISFPLIRKPLHVQAAIANDIAKRQNHFVGEMVSNVRMRCRCCGNTHDSRKAFTSTSTGAEA